MKRLKVLEKHTGNYEYMRTCVMWTTSTLIHSVILLILLFSRIRMPQASLLDSSIRSFVHHNFDLLFSSDDEFEYNNRNRIQNTSLVNTHITRICKFCSFIFIFYSKIKFFFFCFQQIFPAPRCIFVAFTLSYLFVNSLHVFICIQLLLVSYKKLFPQQSCESSKKTPHLELLTTIKYKTFPF